MPKTTVLDNTYATVWYHPEKKIVHHQIHKFLFGPAFREVLTTGAELIEKHGAKKYLSDDRGNSVVSKEDGEWGNTVWAPRVLKAGWKYWAIVMPEKVIGQMNMKQFAQWYGERGVTVQVFDNPDAALKWLESQ